MFDAAFVKHLVSRSSENPTDRRRFLRAAGLSGAGVAGAGLLASVASATAGADTADGSGPSDSAILNFALNLEYLEGEFYSYATSGNGLPASLTWGKGNRGGVTGGHLVPFEHANTRMYAREIAGDELDHVAFLRATLGSAKVAQPQINIKQAFTTAARAAGLIGPTATFDPYATENNFLLAAFIFEDVGVTAYKGAAPLIHNKTYLGAAAGILAVEAYHAATIRTLLYQRGLAEATDKISNARDSLDGPSDDDQGTWLNGAANIVPSDGNGLAYGRTAARVLNIVYLTPKKAMSGGFFPRGVNGSINTSGPNG